MVRVPSVEITDLENCLINKIHKEIVLEENLVNGALYGHGDYELLTRQ
jgi:hypothetical protein